MPKFMSLTYEPTSDLLHIFAKLLFFNRNCTELILNSEP